MNKPLLSLALTLSCTAAWAADAPPLPAKVAACGSIADAQQRVACYDREIAALSKAPTAATPAAPAAPPAARSVTAAAPPSPPAAAVAPAPATAPAPAPAPAPAAKSATPLASVLSFGQELISKKDRPDPKAPDQLLHAQVKEAREVRPGEYRITLDNDQVWSQPEPKFGLTLKAGDAITIGKAAMGSYRLWRDQDGSKSWVRVTRIS
jgi:hypothetical protein